MEIQNKPIDELKPFKKNPKKHPEKQINMLKKSMQEFGWTNPILISQGNMIIAGHARYQAAQELGFTEVPTIFIDLPYERAVAYVLADNRLAELAEDDEELMLELLDEVTQIPDFDIESIGFDDSEIDELLDNVAGSGEVVEDDYEVPEEIETDIKQGDVIKLGKHTLICGDATDEKCINKLVNGSKISLVFTDPPYDLQGNLVQAAFEISSKFSDLQFWMASDKQQIELVSNNFNKFTHFFVHDFKCATLVSNSQPMQRHNLISKFGNRKMNNLKDGFTTIVQVATERTSEAHKVFRMGKRVELPAQFISHYTQQGEAVLDMFGGSGSTLIACEQLGRICYINELEPARCEIIKQRYEQYKKG